MSKAATSESPLARKLKRVVDEGGPEAGLALMTGNQRSFVEEYIKAFDGPAALRNSSYAVSPENASKTLATLLKHPVVKFAIDYHNKLRAEKVAVDGSFIIAKWLKLVDASEEAAMAGDAKQAATFLRASELIAKAIGLFVERTEVTGKDGEAIKIEETNDAADAFARSISGLVARSRTADEAGGVDARTEGSFSV